jgi:spore coat-associated protein N
MSRLSFLARHPKRTIAALSISLAATAIAVGSGASFTSASSNEANVFTAGTLHHTNTGAGALASTTVSDLKPGYGTTDGTAVDTSESQAGFGKIVVTNDGSLDGEFTVTPTATSTAYTGPLDAASVCGGPCEALGGALKVRVDAVDGSGAPVTVYDDTVSNFAGAHLGNGTVNTFTLAPGATRTYNAYFYLPGSTGNAFQGGSATVNLGFAQAQQ